MTGGDGAAPAGSLEAIGLIFSSGCQAPWAMWRRLFGDAIRFRKYRVAPRLGMHVVRRRLLSELQVLDEHTA